MSRRLRGRDRAVALIEFPARIVQAIVWLLAFGARQHRRNILFAVFAALMLASSLSGGAVAAVLAVAVP